MIFKTKRVRDLEDAVDALEVQNDIMQVMLMRNEEKLKSYSHRIDFYKENFIKAKNRNNELKRERDHFKSLYEALQTKFDYLDRGIKNDEKVQA